MFKSAKINLFLTIRCFSLAVNPNNGVNFCFERVYSLYIHKFFRNFLILTLLWGGASNWCYTTPAASLRLGLSIFHDKVLETQGLSTQTLIKIYAICLSHMLIRRPCFLRHDIGKKTCVSGKLRVDNTRSQTPTAVALEKA